MKAVVFYERAAVSGERIMEIYPRHKTFINLFAKEGKVIAIGTFAEDIDSSMNFGSMGIFKDKQAAEDFVKQDPFVLEGAVAKAIIREWNELLLP